MQESGFSAEIAVALDPNADEEAIESTYEAIRRALHRYEDVVDPPLTVTLTRRAPHPLGEAEIEGAFEICRDALVDVLGVPVDDAGVTWRYEQCEGADALLVVVAPARSPRG